jgi:hypothetical protein
MIALLGSILISIFLYKGFDWIAELSFFQNGYDFYIRQLGLAAHYQNLNKGAIRLEDIIYFFTIILLFGLGAIEQLSGKFKYAWVLLVMLLLIQLFMVYTNINTEKFQTSGKLPKVTSSIIYLLGVLTGICSIILYTILKYYSTDGFTVN